MVWHERVHLATSAARTYVICVVSAAMRGAPHDTAT